MEYGIDVLLVWGFGLEIFFTKDRQFCRHPVGLLQKNIDPEEKKAGPNFLFLASLAIILFQSLNTVNYGISFQLKKKKKRKPVSNCVCLATGI